MIDSKELKKLNKDLYKIGNKLADTVEKLPLGITQKLAAGAMLIRNTIIESMREKKHGLLYKRGKKFHQASAPGEAPAIDRGEGVRSITFDVRPWEIEIGTDGGAPYLAMLEGGTAKLFENVGLVGELIEQRPWLGPAVEKHHKEIIYDVGEEAFKILKKPFNGI